MKIYAVRHLPTKFNKEGILQGTMDNRILPLDEYLLNKIRDNKNVLKSIEFDSVLVSELIRTKQTAIEYKFVDFKEECLINELNFGKYEGKNKQELINEFQDEWNTDFSKLELGENLEDFKNRILSFIKKYQDNQNILIFCHGAFLRGLKAINEGLDLGKMNVIHIENNELIILNFDNKK